ncbi:SDR family oxidoreductase [Roseomonas sp. CECT 9278]|uniref:SDR family oxidoreductase n=1 Tax=Roseomonas sp. CECT 9278 TaxID=2845823 RepID=UPI001E29711C|nr:SDR family oxidoreductase [Roseomonas sp. CECT 9278]CAH0130372.1 4-formylbenzenesulfonate dehydrogenase TsaC1/TsaC2 [Roseomonas sp. CECT 9278]
MTYDPLAAFRMDGHAVIITGGAQNIGAGIARAFAGAGAKVMIADLDGDKATATAATIAAESGQDVRGTACNVTKEADIKATVAAAVAAFGGLSTLVNNVGWGGVNPDPLAVTEEQMIDSYKLNTISAYRMTAACMPHLLTAKNPAVINSGSFSSAVPAYDILAYGTAKAALNQLMVSLAHALAKKVRVNSILIGTVITAGYASAGIDAATQQRMMHPDTLTGRPGTPKDVANAMLWLASPAGSWVSGQTINVHGGGSVVRLFGH